MRMRKKEKGWKLSWFILSIETKTREGKKAKE
jgi:hypothetical protein